MLCWQESGRRCDHAAVKSWWRELRIDERNGQVAKAGVTPSLRLRFFGVRRGGSRREVHVKSRLLGEAWNWRHSLASGVTDAGFSPKLTFDDAGRPTLRAVNFPFRSDNPLS